MQDTSPAVLDQIVPQDETVRNLKHYAELIPEPYGGSRSISPADINGYAVFQLSFEQIGKMLSEKCRVGKSNLPSCNDR